MVVSPTLRDQRRLTYIGDSPFERHSREEYVLVFGTPVSGAPAVASAVAAGAAPVAPVSVAGPGAGLPPLTGRRPRAPSPPVPRPGSAEGTDCLRFKRQAVALGLHTRAHLSDLPD